VALTLPRGAEKRRTVEAMFDRIARRYDRLNGIISLGAHRRWKRTAVESLAPLAGALVVDLACGTGDLAEEVATRGGRAVGVDVSAGMLHQARRRAVAALLVRAEGEALPLADATVDGLVCGFALRNFVDLRPVVDEMARVLRPGGRIALVEVDRPGNALVRRAHGVYFDRVVPLVGGLLSDRWAYRYLPSSAAYLPTYEALGGMLEAAGFTEVAKRGFMAGAIQLLTARRRAGAPAHATHVPGRGAAC
jgi:demethylmenaquinone methyltransferase / 2-methoxy-6-polyprenyl-1,4-benzoquinol methylase